MWRRYEEKSVTLTTVETERHFIQVGRERCFWLTRCHVPTSTALEKREGGFNRVSRDAEAVLVPDAFVGAVIDGLAFRYPSLRKAGSVQDGFVSYDHVYIFADVLGHHFADRLSGCIFTWMNLSAPPRWTMPITTPPCSSWQPPHHAAPLAADVGFINLDCAVQHFVDFGHGVADTMAEIPCGLVVDSEFPLHLVCRMALARFTEQQRSEKPFLQGEMAVIETVPDVTGNW